MSKMPPPPRSRVNRRDFLRAATAAAMAPLIVPDTSSPGRRPRRRAIASLSGSLAPAAWGVATFAASSRCRTSGSPPSPTSVWRTSSGSRRRSISSTATRNAPPIPISASCWRVPTSMRSSSPPENAGIRSSALRRRAAGSTSIARSRSALRWPKASAASSGAEIRRGLPVGHAAALECLLPAQRSWCGTATSATCGP